MLCLRHWEAEIDKPTGIVRLRLLRYVPLIPTTDSLGDSGQGTYGSSPLQRVSTHIYSYNNGELTAFRYTKLIEDRYHDYSSAQFHSISSFESEY